MAPRQIVSPTIPGVIFWELSAFRDDRGWLFELFRNDELPSTFRAAMSYVSMTRPGVTRGPHEHREQSDYFCFIGPSDFSLYLWDNRTGAKQYRICENIQAGESRPLAIVIPPGVVHAYKNIGSNEGWVFNAPDRLYAGENKSMPVDEIRWESDPQSPFRVV